MARIKLKLGENEVEIESRDFYVDNQTVGEVIDSVTKHIQEKSARIVFDDGSSLNKLEKISQAYQTNLKSLNILEDAEAHEPEFTGPVPISAKEITGKLLVLSEKSFFDKPRTVSETVAQLREYGWSASPLEVSKSLAKMAFNKQILKNSRDHRCYYFARKAILTN